jgi:hypothetical protein
LDCWLIFRLEPRIISSTFMPGAETSVPCTGVRVICRAIVSSPLLAVSDPPKLVKKPV